MTKYAERDIQASMQSAIGDLFFFAMKYVIASY